MSHDPTIGQDTLAAVTAPVTVAGQRAPALRFDHPRTQALLAALVVFRLLPQGFANRDLRAHLGPLLGVAPSAMTQGRMTYDLRRLRLHGLIERVPGTHRYQVTSVGMRTALLFTRTHARVLRPGLAQLVDPDTTCPSPLRQQFDKLDAAIDRFVQQARLAA